LLSIYCCFLPMSIPTHLPFLSQAEWLGQLSAIQPVARQMLERSDEDQRRLGYFHTFREIGQQPSTWLGTVELMQSHAAELRDLVDGISCLALSGSGSSEYAGDCARPALRKSLGINVEAVPAGALLTSGRYALPVGKPSLMVSLARSGDSPESVGALALVRQLEPEVRHLILTCNREGRLANAFGGDPMVRVITLDDATNDRSLVMTSSFTNMVLGASFLGFSEDSAAYTARVGALARSASRLLHSQLSGLAELARKPFRRALFLGSGARFAAAREASLKMLEMTAGRVTTMCETWLGLRHGPMSGVHGDTLVVCFLSSDPVTRAYEADVLREMDQKRLGLARIIAGQNVTLDLACAQDLVVPYQCPDLADEDLTVLDVMVGQLLALFRCLHEGLRPDSPSEAGVIRRVVRSFTLHPL
jgi:tagatose-6-phosphate ketose/aldose isomerase